ncbi:MAG TPA: citramalate synthase [Candidatus Acidoferrales bacterium]|nr:citramalate synthase [Candidatus Acidoferrales bacterium]
MEQIYLYDTTLRDGTQGEEISFSVEDKIKIAHRLDAFGMDYIEGGWPGSNPKDMEFFERMKTTKLKHAKLASFGSTCRASASPDSDENVAQLLRSETPVVTIFGKSWDMHVTTALGTTHERNLEIISATVKYLKDSGKEVVYDAEHFFDGFKSNPEYALKTLRAAESAGADFIVLCDTNGGTLSNEVEAIVKNARESVNTKLGIHAHNDSELAVSNSLAAVRGGCVQVQGTINGFGERCGNANLCSIIPDLQLKMGHPLVPEAKLKTLTELSRFVSEVANLQPRKNLPYVGQSAFAHKGGVHVSAVMKSARTYEHIEPDLVGNSRRVLVSDLSGKSNVLYKAEELGIDLSRSNGQVNAIVNELKSLENDGYVFEDADASLEILMKKDTGKAEIPFELEALRIIIEKNTNEGITHTEAVIKLRVGDKIEHTAAEGNGPVNALDNALRKALLQFYPHLSTTKLSDYKVRVVDGGDGTGAKVRVLIETADEESNWNTVGVSENIIEASWKALVDSIVYKMMKDNEKKKNAALRHPAYSIDK